MFENGKPYIVVQLTLKEAFIGTQSKNIKELEDLINDYAYRGYRLHTLTTTESSSKGLAGGDRIQATVVFERISN